MVAIGAALRTLFLLMCVSSEIALPAQAQDKLQSTGGASSIISSTRDGRGEASAAVTQPVIPRLIHQSWKYDNVPQRFRDWSWTWKELHKTWSYKLQTDRSMRELAEEKYSWFLPTYDQLPKNIRRVDAAPYMLMHDRGGLFIDLDFHALSSHDPILQDLEDKVVILASSTTKHSDEHSILNTWMASVPGHDLWIICLKEVARSLEEQQKQRIVDPSRFVEPIAGPALLSRAIQVYKASMTGKGKDDISILPPGAVLPPGGGEFASSKASSEACSMTANGFDAQACRQAFPKAYAVAIRAAADGSKTI